MSAYVDFSSSEESEQKVAVPKRRRNDDSESGSDVSILKKETKLRISYNSFLFAVQSLW